MTPLQLTPTDQEFAAANAEAAALRSRESVRVSQHTPYLKGFGVDIGAFEMELPPRTIVIGRSDDADLHLPLQHVSRCHAKIAPQDGRFVLTDAGSAAGTTVNGRKCDERILEHGDNIQIGPYLLQFRTHEPLAGAKQAAARAKTLLRSDYCTLPSIMRLQFRTLSVGPCSIFAAGDTLKVGQGGLLIPTSNPPADDTCLELHLAVTQKVTKCFLGEIMGVIPESDTHWVCTKLHTIPRHVYEEIVARATAGPWTDVLST